MSTETELQEETEKWHTKLRNRLEQVTAVDATGADLLTNAQAYVQDADHFKEQEDWVRAFESVVWGWAWIEIGERLTHIEEKKGKERGEKG